MVHCSNTAADVAALPVQSISAICIFSGETILGDLCKLKYVPDFSNSVYVSSLFFVPHSLLPLSPASLPLQMGHVTTTNELHLFSVTDSDVGTYQCTADNGLGTATASATLTILGNNGLGHTISLL